MASTKITVTIDNRNNAKLFLGLLSALKFVKHIESEESPEEYLSAGDMKVLDERWDDYLKNPGKTQSWESVKATILKKHAAGN